MEEGKPSAEAPAKSKLSWPRWKKLTLAGVVLVIVVGLSVGLGVGLTRNKGGDDDTDDGDDGQPGNKTKGNETDLAGRPLVRASKWEPKVNDSWQIILRNTIDASGDLNPDVDVWDIDMYENDVATIDKLHSAGKKVICYFSAGSWEDWRDDKDEFADEDLGKQLVGWPHERWLKLSSTKVRDIMKKRIAVAAAKGCDAIDPDNVDGYENKNGLGLTEQDSVDYMRFLHEEAKAYNMSLGLKNAGAIIDDILDIVDFNVNEQCVEHKECETFSKFINAGKPVFHIEYPKSAPNVPESDAKAICSRKDDSVGSDDFSTVIKTMDLDGWVLYCDGKSYETKLEN